MKGLLDAYLTLRPWPDSVAALRKLKASGVRIITISNFSPKMLQANADNAGIADLFDELLSTEANGTYKPDPRAYALGMERLKLKKEEIVFAAFGGWDAYGAKSFGYTTYWVNRFSLPPEELGIEPDLRMLPHSTVPTPYFPAREAAAQAAIARITGAQWAFWPLSPEQDARLRRVLEARVDDLLPRTDRGYTFGWIDAGREVLITWEPRR